jgi:hypothetical protein
VSSVRRLLVTLTALLAVTAWAGGLAQPAAADPIFHLHYPNVTGSTTLAKPNVTAAIPKSVVDADLDLANGNLTGQAQIPDFPVTIRVAGLVPVTSIVRMVPVGQLTGHLTDTFSATSTFTLRLVRVFQPALPRLNLVPSGCQTRTPVTVNLVNTTPVNIFDTTISGTYTLPRFTRCGLLTPVLDLLLSGPGNTLTLRLQAS